jgi:hypothetical protein
LEKNKGASVRITKFQGVDALRQAEAVAFLRALREVGNLRLEKIGGHAFVLRFEAVTSLEALRDNLFFENEVPLEELFEKYGADLFKLLQQEAS